ncbi:MAG: hypothetical protein ABIF40_01795 [archaeon]
MVKIFYQKIGEGQYLTHLPTDLTQEIEINSVRAKRPNGGVKPHEKNKISLLKRLSSKRKCPFCPGVEYSQLPEVVRGIYDVNRYIIFETEKDLAKLEEPWRMRAIPNMYGNKFLIPDEEDLRMTQNPSYIRKLMHKYQKENLNMSLSELFDYSWLVLICTSDHFNANNQILDITDLGLEMFLANVDMVMVAHDLANIQNDKLKFNTFYANLGKNKAGQSQDHLHFQIRSYDRVPGGIRKEIEMFEEIQTFSRMQGWTVYSDSDFEAFASPWAKYPKIVVTPREPTSYKLFDLDEDYKEKFLSIVYDCVCSVWNMGYELNFGLHQSPRRINSWNQVPLHFNINVRDRIPGGTDENYHWMPQIDPETLAKRVKAGMKNPSP